MNTAQYCCPVCGWPLSLERDWRSLQITAFHDNIGEARLTLPEIAAISFLDKVKLIDDWCREIHAYVDGTEMP